MEKNIYKIGKELFITNDEEIKEGDWCVDTYKLKNNHNPIFKWSDKFKVDAKKIILTTDQELIKDGVQAIDDEFLEWFVKNPSCESVEIDSKLIVKQTKPLIQHQGNKLIVVPHKIKYKIIIPKKEPKQENCCTPVGQIKRYVDCVGCDRKPKQMSKQTAVEQFLNAIKDQIPLSKEHLEMIESYAKQAKEMEKEQSQNYAIFAIRCDRTEMRILEFNDYIKLEENENK
jgi:hypothetical protein